MARSGWVAVLITALLVGGFGSRAADKAAAKADSDVSPLLHSVTAFPRWSTDSFSGDSDMVGPIVLKVVLLLACVFICAGLAGRVGPSMASFLGGWAAVMVSAALAGAVFNVVVQLVVESASGDLLPRTTNSLNSGVLFGLYTGWLVGAGVIISARNVRVEPRWVPPVPGPVPSDGQVVPGYPPLPVPVPTPTSAYAPAFAPAGDFAPPALPAGPAPPASAPTPGPQPAPPPEDEEDADDGAPLWSSAWPGRSGGAYGPESDSSRPSWTRWSSRDDS